MFRESYGKCSRWLACAVLVACSSSDGSGDSAAASANDMAPAGNGSGEPGGEATSPAAAGNSGNPGSAASSPATGSPGSEPVNEALPLTPSTMPPGVTPAAPAPTGAPLQQPRPDLISARQEHAVVALGGEIYVIGGFTPMVTATVEAFDTAAQTWRAVASLPVALHHANAASINGRIYVAGFYLGGSFTDADPRVFEYDPSADSWSERTAMPAGSERATSCVTVLEGKMYLFGGARATTVSDASVYDVAADSWQALPPLPEAREHCVAGAIGGTLYIASGRAGGITGF
jgi:N-acetylneuraminic acid mutarotase